MKLTNRRDCFTIDIYYFRSVQEVPDAISRAVEMVSKEFESFLWTLGWPIDTSHSGYKGNVNAERCPVSPYFANLNIEIVFRSLYLHRKEVFPRPISLPISRIGSSASGMSTFEELPFSLSSFKTPRNRSKSVGIVSPNSYEGILDLFDHSEPETVAISWLEDIHNVSHLMHQLPKHIIGCLMLHPLPNSTGLYYVRLFVKSGTSEDCLVSLIYSLLDCWPPG